ncbi:zf-DHHC domain-containing protein [Polypterus senegalus]|uniref:zf-DHHC domain-containing protein n=1 Tax=Polypterus senegalus TaxID=55291 RepID=UPI0019636A32|nr:zf-DHHC domain-containing protein [Polypterus senegalus]
MSLKEFWRNYNIYNIITFRIDYWDYWDEMKMSNIKGLASLYSIALVISTWIWRIRSEREGEAVRGGEEMGPSKHVVIAHYIILLVESVLFGVFVMVIFYDQLVSIITDETPIEQIRNRLMRDKTVNPHFTRKPKLALLREVFGRGSIFCWFFPVHPGPPSSGGISYSALPDYDV